MSPPSIQPLKRSPTTLWRIRFIPGDAPPSARVLCRFADPVSAVAVVEDISARNPAEESPLDCIDVMAAADAREQGGAFLAGGKENLPVSFKLPNGRIAWRPGRAVIEGDPAWCQQALVVVAQFAFYEARLRMLESAIASYESAAGGDIALAYRPQDKHESQWDRLGKTMEELAQIRLMFARLEPGLLYRSPAHKPEERRIFSRLCRAANTEDRLEAATNRLEACEDLYEGAIDRINDHRWYRKGHRLELTIVVLLIIEVVQIAGELWFHLHSGR